MICIIRKTLFNEYNRIFSQHIMLKSPSLEKENIIKDVRNLFRLEKLKNETTDTTIKDIRKFFRLEKENKAIKDRILRDILETFLD